MPTQMSIHTGMKFYDTTEVILQKHLTHKWEASSGQRIWMQRKGCEFTASNWSKYDSGNVATGLQSRWKHFYKNMTLILSLIFHKITKKEKYAIYLKKKKKSIGRNTTNEIYSGPIKNDRINFKEKKKSCNIQQYTRNGLSRPFFKCSYYIKQMVI